MRGTAELPIRSRPSRAGFRCSRPVQSYGSVEIERPQKWTRGAKAGASKQGA
jgi:hypothetical protein